MIEDNRGISVHVCLYGAANGGNLDVCQALIAGGAECNIKNEVKHSNIECYEPG